MRFPRWKPSTSRSPPPCAASFIFAAFSLALLLSFLSVFHPVSRPFPPLWKTIKPVPSLQPPIRLVSRLVQSPSQSSIIGFERIFIPIPSFSSSFRPISRRATDSPSLFRTTSSSHSVARSADGKLRASVAVPRSLCLVPFGPVWSHILVPLDWIQFHHATARLHHIIGNFPAFLAPLKARDSLFVIILSPPLSSRQSFTLSHFFFLFPRQDA